jgi:hypothetical protein
VTVWPYLCVKRVVVVVEARLHDLELHLSRSRNAILASLRALGEHVEHNG